MKIRISELWNFVRLLNEKFYQEDEFIDVCEVIVENKAGIAFSIHSLCGVKQVFFKSKDEEEIDACKDKKCTT